MNFKSYISAIVTSLLFGATAVEAQTQGLNNLSKKFTDPKDIVHADIIDREQIQRTWDAAIVRVPTGLSRSKRTSFEELAAEYGDGKKKFPTAIYMHGCSGFWSGTFLRVKFLADNGFLVIAPASMARTVYARLNVCRETKTCLNRMTKISPANNWLFAL